MSLIYNGSIQSQYLKRVAVMQDSTLLETGSQLVFLRKVAPVRERGFVTRAFVL